MWIKLLSAFLCVIFHSLLHSEQAKNRDKILALLRNQKISKILRIGECWVRRRGLVRPSGHHHTNTLTGKYDPANIEMLFF